jgi:hypothetical protein
MPAACRHCRIFANWAEFAPNRRPPDGEGPDVGADVGAAVPPPDADDADPPPQPASRETASRSTVTASPVAGIARRMEIIASSQIRIG